MRQPVTRKQTDIPTINIPIVLGASGKARPVKGGSYLRNKDGSLALRSPHVPSPQPSSQRGEGASNKEEK